jgi:hypothetical protein
MRPLNFILGLAACLAILLSAGCAGGQTAGSLTGSAGMPAALRTAHFPPPCATPKVWISQPLPSFTQVEGYRANGTPIPCSANNGSASGTLFIDATALASDAAGNYYVVDTLNYRVVVFNSAGGYIDTLDTKTSVQPYGVCVSPSGVVGVADTEPGSTGDVEFFTSGVSGNYAAPTGWATGVDVNFQWCAFDKAGNFLATGTTSAGAQQIVYLSAADVNLASQTLLSSGIATGPDWGSMYVQLKCSAGANGEVLAVSDLTPSPPTIQFWKINPATGRPTALISTLSLTGYPSGANNMEQDAPDNTCYTKAFVYFADYGGSKALRTREYSGAIGVFNGSVNGAYGVATNPTGQE